MLKVIFNLLKLGIKCTYRLIYFTFKRTAKIIGDI